MRSQNWNPLTDADIYFKNQHNHSPTGSKCRLWKDNVTWVNKEWAVIIELLPLLSSVQVPGSVKCPLNISFQKTPHHNQERLLVQAQNTTWGFTQTHYHRAWTSFPNAATTFTLDTLPGPSMVCLCCWLPASTRWCNHKARLHLKRSRGGWNLLSPQRALIEQIAQKPES